MSLKHPLVFAIALLLSNKVTASPTSSDFEICKKEAVKVLEYCFTKHVGYDSEIYQCWPENEQGYRNCVDRVIARHSDSPEKRRLMQEKKAAALKLMAELKAKQQAENN